ncbi:MAG: hypothetical protein KIT34_13420 [Cyanobacteria bacterium TGS_CYA1]|nr:hypothetical protein [Cyanobacteria bacterium TGS_CYA1]
MSSLKSERVELRLDSQVFDKIDEWRSREADIPNRSEAIRRLIQKGLSASDRQAYTGVKLQILLAATLPESEEHMTDAFVYAFAYDIYPAFDAGKEKWAEPFEPCFEITKEMMLSLHGYLEDLWKRNENLTFKELEKAYKSKDWTRTKLIRACRYMRLSDLFPGKWETMLSGNDSPVEAKNIIKGKPDRKNIFIA